MKAYPALTDYGSVLMLNHPNSDYVLIGDPVNVTFKLKDKESISKELIVGLKDKASKIRAVAESECSQIEEKIQSLLALPNK